MHLYKPIHSNAKMQERSLSASIGEEMGKGQGQGQIIHCSLSMLILYEGLGVICALTWLAGEVHNFPHLPDTPGIQMCKLA